MSRAKIETKPYLSGGGTMFEIPPMQHEPGVSGSLATMPITGVEPRVRGELGRLLEAARTIRPILREEQADTEERGHYSPRVHEYFRANDFYKLLLPRRFGGLELGPCGFFMVIAEIGRGCPSTAWCLSLSQAHTLTLASYWPLRTQDEVFGRNGYLIAPASGNPTSAKVRRVDGGFRVSGFWRYCSGAPYSTHFFPTIEVPAEGEQPAYRAWAVIDRADYRVQDDWGRVIGMRGSGSNSIEIAEPVFVPEHRVVAETWTNELAEPAPGATLHGNPAYSGAFFAFAEGEVAAATVGLGYAAIDEFERIVRISKAPFDDSGALRAERPDWQRVLSVALAKVDAAAAALFDGGRRYEEYGRLLVENGETFDAGRSMRLNQQYFIAEELVWEALQAIVRAAGTGPQADGQKIQRYFRDVWTAMTRADQLEFFGAASTRARWESEARLAAPSLV
ncbi:acyl-CoA dehydrogenase family protein [Sciscionella marina]|uniref:acyl-CoA dehydrogenase family protein n=1 Tax=Sciscionella marina TaxID=508770 RepID=UPI0003AA1DB6|nr:acyl-CoA dehydrogenase family protein [Sciscionella marina]